MFIFVAILFIIIGIILFIKSNKMDNSQRAKLIVRMSSVCMIILGVVLFYYVANGNLVLPLKWKFL